MSTEDRIPLIGLPDLSEPERLARAEAFLDLMRRRRSVRDFSDRSIDRRIIEACVRTAGQAPSGANQQPWHFEVVGDPDLKRRIRLAAEAEEHAFYEQRAPDAWLEALAPLGTDAAKPFLEIAPWLIVVFEQRHGLTPDGERVQHYYSKESVGLATGFLIAALHNAGLATLTHTPSPMGFLNEILERPPHEKPFLLLVTGHAVEGATVPDISRKDPEQYIHFRQEQSDDEPDVRS